MSRFHLAAASRRVAVAGVAGVLFVMLVGCSGGGSSDTKALQQQVTALQTQVAKLQTDLATEQAKVDRLTAQPTAAAPAAAATTTYHDFGFSIPLPAGVQVKTAGLSSAQATADQGQLAASSGGVSLVLLWTKQQLTPQQAVQGAFQVLQASQSTLKFAPVKQGDIQVDSRPGAYGAFTATAADSSLLGAGVIGGWTCGNSETYSMTVAGKDLNAVQDSFAGFTAGFKCP